MMMDDGSRAGPKQAGSHTAAQPGWRYFKHETLVLLFSLGLFAAATLPILPVWGDVLRLFAISVLMLHRRVPRWFGIPLAAVLAGLMLMPMGNAHITLLLRPLQYIADAVHNVMGAPLNVVPGSMLLIVNTVLALCLGWLAWRESRKGSLSRYALITLMLLATAMTVNAALSLYTALDETSEALDIWSFSTVMAASAIWYAFILAAFAVLLLVKTPRDRTVMLVTIGAAAVFQAVLALLQIALDDWSYILEFPGAIDYIQRVRGAYYYHGSLGLFLCVGLFAMVSLIFSVRRKWLPMTGFVIIACTMALNSTRALSIGICLGAVICLICFWRNRATVYRPLVAALVLVIPVFASLVVYDKAELKPEGDESSVEMMAQTNVARFDLARGAINAIEERPLYGYGPSCIIPLSGRVLGGERCTDSSHMLIIDTALQSGIPAALLLLIFVGGLGAVLAWRLVIRRDLDPSLIGALGMIAMLSIATLFFPKERDWNLMIIFVVLAISIAAVDFGRPASAAPAPAASPGRRTRAWIGVGFGLSVLSSIVWTVASSPSYAMPLIDFLRARALMNSQNAEQQTIYTNSPALARTGGALFRLGARWVPNLRYVDFHVLPDDPQALRELPGATWVMWTGARDKRYPRVLEAQHFNFFRPYGLAPSFVLPYGWELVRSSSPAVSLLRIGSSFQPLPLGTNDFLCGRDRDSEGGSSIFRQLTECRISAPLNELREWRRIAPWLTELQFKLSDSELEDDQRSKSRRILSPNRHTDLEYDVVYNDGRKVFYDEHRSLSIALGEAERIKSIDMRMLANSSYLRIESTGVAAVGIDVVRSDAVKVGRGDAFKPAPFLGDGRITTSWVGNDGDQILIDARRAGRSEPLLYELVPANYDKPQGQPPLRWVLEGSNDGTAWVELDNRTRKLDQYAPGETVWYPLNNAAGYDFYRFTLTAQRPGEKISLVGMRLYTKFPGNTEHD